MTQIIKLTVALLLLFCLYAFIIGVVNESLNVGLYYAILGVGSLFFPVLIFVVIYHFLFSKRFNYSNRWLGFLAKSISLILISFVGLFIWALLEFLMFSGIKLDMKHILDDYQHEYLGYMPPIIILAFLIPIGYYFFKPKTQKIIIVKDSR
jgi:amino acid transporter